MHTSSVPRSGGLQILLSPSQTPLAGYNGEAVAGRDLFLIIAKDWVSAQDRTLEYEFRYIQVPPCCTAVPLPFSRLLFLASSQEEEDKFLAV